MIASMPAFHVHAADLYRVVAQQARHERLLLTFACLHWVEGEAWRGRPDLRATLRIFNMAFFKKIIMRHDTGMGEAYMDGDYEASCWRHFTFF